MSVADELKKLADLQAQGILTQADFDGQKAKLLSEGVATPPPSSPQFAPPVYAPPAYDPAPPMSLPEQTFFQDTNPQVLVSSLRIILGNQTFATQNVSSVGISNNSLEITKQKSALIVLGLMVAGFGALMAWMLDIGPVSGGLIVIGVVLFIFAANLKLTHFVLITGGGGNMTPLSSPNIAYIQQVVAAINQAIMHRH